MLSPHSDIMNFMTYEDVDNLQELILQNDPDVFRNLQEFKYDVNDTNDDMDLTTLIKTVTNNIPKKPVLSPNICDIKVDLSFKSLQEEPEWWQKWLSSQPSISSPDLSSIILKQGLYDFFTGTVEVGGERKISPESFMKTYNMYNVQLLPFMEINTEMTTPNSVHFFDKLEQLSTSPLALQFIRLIYGKNLTAHATLMVFDNTHKEAYYFDSNGPDSSTTPPQWRKILAECASDIGYNISSFNMLARPQLATQDIGCAAWSVLGGLLAIKKMISGEKPTLDDEDFALINYNLYDTITYFMQHCIRHIYGVEAIFINQYKKFQALKETITLQGLPVPDRTILEKLFIENEGSIGKCMEHWFR